MKQIIKNALILTAITLISGVLLGLVYEVTKGPIAASKERAKKEAYQKVLPDAKEFSNLIFDADVVSKAIKDAGITGCTIDEVVIAKSGKEAIGYIVTAKSSEGYGGDIQVSVGILNDGTISGVAILSISETVGLGMKASEPKFYEQFSGKKVDEFVVTKTGAKADHEIDAISGATITSNAMTNAVNAALAYFNQVCVIGGGVNE